MKIEKIPIDQINPATYNPRRDLKPGDKIYEQLKRSIEEFGIVQVLVWNRKTENLVGGHQTLKILKALGKKMAYCTVVNLPLKKEIALNQALNKIRGEWDHKKLVMAFKMVEMEDSGFDFTVTGFSLNEIEDIKLRFGMGKKPELEFAEELLLEHNYIVLYFDNPMDWQVAVDKFGLKKVRPLLKIKNETIGIGRVVKGKEWLSRIN